jgi:hypothetical protein
VVGEEREGRHRAKTTRKGRYVRTKFQDMQIRR